MQVLYPIITGKNVFVQKVENINKKPYFILPFPMKASTDDECAFPPTLQSTNSRNILSPWIHSIPLPPSLLSFHQRTVGILPPNPLPLWQNPRACAPIICEAEISSTICTREEAIIILEEMNCNMGKDTISNILSAQTHQ